MRIYSNSFELMSEMGRELNSYGQTVKPKTYQNKVIEGNEDFITKELICQQYCLTSLGDPVWLFVFSHSREWADAEFQERIDTSDIINIPCSMYYDFLIRQNGKGEKVLHICYHQRSSDFVTHFGNDVYLAWKLMEYVAKEVGVKPGYLYHTIDSLHAYKKDWLALASNLEDLQEKY